MHDFAPPEPARSGQVATLTSRPDRPDDDVDDAAIAEHEARLSYPPTPPFVLLSDTRTTPTPRLQAKPSPRATSVNKYWFNPPWIEENSVPDVDHGEFESPVWLAVAMTMQADRNRELDEAFNPGRGRRAGDESSGQLRSLLNFVNNTKRSSASHRSPGTSSMGRTVNAVETARYHELAPRHAKPSNRFIHFVSNSFKKVSVNHN